ncbi:hypothetical protein AB0I49_07730 [Streptomyces sp. NPDC050617]|uniref:hypothetical protein n=1 Tax=Streptomyces sp. NPDC050617 TaxID=3154628 RepID=UPI003428C86D
MAFGLGALIGEPPTATPAAGCALVIATVWCNSRRPAEASPGRRAGGTAGA